MPRGAEPGQASDISYSFEKLRAVLDSFSDLQEGRPRRSTEEGRALRLVTELGDTVVPLLSRKLRSPDEDEASWAYHLLVRHGGERAAAEARALALDERVCDDKKALALALLAELGAELPESVTLRDPESLRVESVRGLLDSIGSPADAARMVDLLLEQVSAEDLPEFLEDMVDVAGCEAGPLLDEILVRDDVPGETLQALRRIRARLGGSRWVVRHPRRRRRRVTYLGEHTDGRLVVVVLQRHPTARPPRLRALVTHIDHQGVLSSCRYEAEILPRSGEKRVVRSLMSQGFALSPVTVDEAARLVARAARAARERNLGIPRAYYLGRDLLGLTDEHLRDERPDEGDGGALLARALQLLGVGDAAGARPLLEVHLRRQPDDAEARTALGTCLLQAGEEEAALHELTRAARLEPDDAIRHWNLAWAAREIGRLGACYLALGEYLARRDTGEGAAERRRDARAFRRRFEHVAGGEHPDVPAERVARAEELFDRAYRHFVAGRTHEAISGFEAVLTLVPSHYPSWGNLGAAYLKLRDLERAKACLEKALSFRPDYEIARQNLSMLQ